MVDIAGAVADEWARRAGSREWPSEPDPARLADRPSEAAGIDLSLPDERQILLASDTDEG